MSETTWYLVRCIDCDAACGMVMPIPFVTADECSDWALAHTEATGHTTSVWQEPKVSKQAAIEHALATEQFVSRINSKSSGDDS